MPKSIQKQLQEAIDGGNLELAKQLVEKMKEKNKPKKIKRKKREVNKVSETNMAIEEPKRQRKEESNVSIVDFTHTNNNDDGDDDNVKIIKDKSNKGVECKHESLLGRKRFNRFHDDRTEATEELQNKEFKKLYAPADKNRVNRSKRTITKAKVVCAGCGTIEIVSMDLAPSPATGGRYWCNDCSISKRG